MASPVDPPFEVSENPDTIRYDLEVETSLVGWSLQKLKDGDTFAVLNSHGDIAGHNAVEGLFHRDTRFLSQLELRFQGRKLLLLNSSNHDDKAALSVDLTNPISKMVPRHCPGRPSSSNARSFSTRECFTSVLACGTSRRSTAA